MSSFYSTHHDRSDVNFTIEYFLDVASNEIHEGKIENISEKGLCLITSTFLKEDDVITIRDEIFLPSHTAKVCWVFQYENLYKVGLTFI